MARKEPSAWLRSTGAFAIARPAHGAATFARAAPAGNWLRGRTGMPSARRRCEYLPMSLQLAGIWRYPVKSCRGEQLAEARVEPWGLAGDRRWMVVDQAGNPVTAREHPRMLLITPGLDAGGDKITLSSPDLPDLVVPVPSGAELVQASVWG